MASKYIDNGAYALTGYTLSGVFQSITIGTKGSLGGGTGLLGGTREAYTIVNRGRITGIAGGVYQPIGIELQKGGSITNGAGALIDGYDGISIKGAAGHIANAGTIEGIGNDSLALYLQQGGTVTNSAGALIKGFNALESLSGSVTNAGSIIGTGMKSVGVFLDSGGTVTNSGTKALIQGYNAIYVEDGAGVVANTGTIEGGSGYGCAGVKLAAGGRVSNAAGALISGGREGVFVAGATVSNSGRIISEGKKGTGVYLDGNGGSFVNNAGGLVEGSYAGALGSAVNSGTIIGTTDGVIGAADNAGIHGLIKGKVGVLLNSAGTVTNFGTIASTAGASGIAINLETTDDVLINEAGSVFIGVVQANKGLMKLAGTKGVLNGLGPKFNAFGLTDELATASWTFNGTNQIGAGAEMLFDGTALVTGTISGAGGLLAIGGGTTTLDAGTSLTVSSWALQKATVVLGVSIAYAGNFSESGVTFELAKHVFTLSGPTTFTAGVFNGGGGTAAGGTLATKGTVALKGLTVNGGGIWQDFGVVGESVALTLGSAAGASGTLTVKPGATFDIVENVGIAITAGGKGAINNNGLFEKTAGTGTSTIAPAIANGGTISIKSGKLELQGAVSGTGTELIGKAGTLKFDAAVAATQTLKFGTTAGGDLMLSDPLGNNLSFAGTVSGLTGTDKLDLTTFAFANKPTLAFKQNGATGVLTVTDGAKVARITLMGQFAAAGFKAANDGTGGTVITFTPAAKQVADLAPPHH